MTVVSKKLIDEKMGELESNLKILQDVLAGRALSMDEGAHYVARPEMVQELRGINVDKLLTAIGHFRVSLDALARLKTQAQKFNNTKMFVDERGQYPY